jgi:hypothetical protein
MTSENSITLTLGDQTYRKSDGLLPEGYTATCSTSFEALAARLFFRLLHIVLSMIAPQLIHFQA